jgi:hypothetical protein
MLGIITERFDKMEQSFQAMSRVKMNPNRLTDQLAQVYPDSKEPAKQELVQWDGSWSEYFLDFLIGAHFSPSIRYHLWPHHDRTPPNGCSGAS